MHNIYGIALILIVSNFQLNILGAVIKNQLPKSIYDLLVEHSTSKCPYMKSTKLLEPKPRFLDRCSDFATLKSTTLLTRDTQDDILCLLYFNNFITLCNMPVTLPLVVNNTQMDIFLKSYNLQYVCYDLSESKLLTDFKNTEAVLPNLKKPEVCNVLCKEVLNDAVMPICSFAGLMSNVTEILRKVNTKMQAEGKVENLAEKPETPNEKTHTYNIKKPGEIDQVNQGDAPLKPKFVENTPIQSNVNVNKNDMGKIPDLKDKIPEEDKSSDVAVKDTLPVESPTKLDETKPDDDQEKISPVKDKIEEHSVPEERLLDADDVKPPIEDVKPADSSSVKTSEISQEKKVESVDNQKDKSDSGTAENTAAEPPVNQRLPINPNTPSVPAVVLQNNEIDIDDDERQEGPSDDGMNNEEIEDPGEPIEQEPPKVADKRPNAKPQETDEDVMIPAYNSSNSDEEDSFFFIYFMMVCAVFILGYVGYHNKQKVLALVIEGRRGRRGSRRGRPNSANYHKLDSNLEEAVTSACNKNTTNIIY